MAKSYTILMDSKRKGIRDISEGTVKITEEGALIIWEAYEALFGKFGQTMEKREDRGGICWLSEIDYFKNSNVLDKAFNYKDYVI